MSVQRPEKYVKPANFDQMPPEEKRVVFVHWLMEVLFDLVEKNVPELGRGDHQLSLCDFPGTRNEAHLFLQVTMTKRHLFTRMRRPDRDEVLSNYIVSGSKEEILTYLADKTHVPELLESLESLSREADERY